MRQASRLLWIFNFVLLWAETDALAFVGSIRKQYPSCVVCHVAPPGGGVLTAYGRGAGDEFLPQWYEPGESADLYGLVKANPTVMVGGDIRIASAERRRGGVLTRRIFPMQLEVEPALEIGMATLAVQIGAYAGGLVEPRRAYLMYQFGDSGFRMRLGKFIPAYGLNLTNHTALVRDSLGLGQGTEVDGAEVSLIGKMGEIFLHAFNGPEKEGVLARVGWYASPALHIGINGLWRREFNDQYRIVGGIYTAWGINSDTWFLLEADYEARFDEVGIYTSGRTINYAQIGRDIARGWQVTGTIQSGLDDRLDTETRYITGIGWIPRPHFELTFDYGLTKVNQKTSTLALFIFHYWH